MNLYIVIRDDEYAGQEVYGVCPTQEEAEKAILDELKEEEEGMWEDYRDYLLDAADEGAEKLQSFGEYVWDQWGYNPKDAINPNDVVTVDEDDEMRWSIVCVSVSDRAIKQTEAAAYKRGWNAALEHITDSCTILRREGE